MIGRRVGHGAAAVDPRGETLDPLANLAVGGVEGHIAEDVEGDEGAGPIEGGAGASEETRDGLCRVDCVLGRE